MLSQQWVARLVTITALILSAGRMALAIPGLQGSQARTASQAGTVRLTSALRPTSAVGLSGVTSYADKASLAGDAHHEAIPRGLRAAAAQHAPLVSDAASPHSKRGLPAPPMTAAMLRANANKQVMARRFLASRRHAPRKRDRAHRGQRAGPDTKCARRSCLIGLPAARSLPATQQPQITNYYCGPATVSEMLRQVGAHVSQSRAARQLHTTAGGTDWSDARGYPVPDVLNADQKRNSYVAVALPWSPTNAQIKTYENDLVTDINRAGGSPLAGNAYEVPGGPHLAGHPPNQEISHWFDIRGYADSGAITKYEDSVHGAPSIGWSAAVPAYSALSSSTIVNVLGARGYDW